MSVVRGFGLNGKSFYNNITKPMEVMLQFTVAAANSAGLGITSLKSNGYVQNVFMHTSQTPGANNGYTNPNPAAGLVMIQLKQNFNVFLQSLYEINSPNSGSDIKIDNSAMSAGQVYTITTLGNATAAKWAAIGVPPGVTPAVGVSFVALSDGGSGNTITSRVQVPSVSGVNAFEIIGNPNVNGTLNVASNGGVFLYGQFLAPSIAAPTFSGSALGAHTHDLLIKGGQAASTTNDVATYSGPILGKEQATDATILGANSATAGGVVAASAGTPAGTISAPAASLVPTAPAAGSIVSLRLYFDGSTVSIPDSAGGSGL